MSNSSENEDDPDMFESSGSEWDSTEEGNTEKKKPKRAPKRTRAESLSSDEEEEEEEDEEDEDEDDDEDAEEGEVENGVPKKPKVEGKDGESPAKKKSGKRSFKGYSTGSFLIAKKDAQVGDPKKHPCIWRVDGKALLQKYEPFEEEGKVRHRTTSVYTGWSPMEKDLYAPVLVTVNQQNSRTLIVDLDWEAVKRIPQESDD